MLRVSLLLLMATSITRLSPTYTPHEGQQTLFHVSDVFEVLYGGEAGGGKTAALTGESTRQVENSNYQGIIFRRTNDELEQIKIEARKMFPAAGGHYRESDNTGIFPSGARVYLRYMQYEQDCTKYQGREFQYIGFDELTHFTENQYTYLFSRCRTTDPTLMCYVRSSANPGGTGHIWVKGRFIDAVPANLDRTPAVKWFWSGRDRGEWVTKEVPQGTEDSYSRAFIPASRFDNPTLMKSDPGYAGRIRGMHDPLLAEAILTGNWDLFAGQFFTKFRKQIHVIPADSVEIAPWWTHIRGLDRGFAAPFCAEWMAVDGDGNVYFYDELYIREKTPWWLAEAINKKTGDTRIDYTYGGRDFWVRNPMSWKREDAPAYVAEHEAAAFLKGGINITPANQDRKQGWALMHRLMDWEGDIATGLTRRPKFFILEGRCPNLEKQIVAAARDPNDVEDLPDDFEDHALEAARYAAMHLWAGVAPAQPVPQLRQEIEALMRTDKATGTYEW